METGIDRCYRRWTLSMSRSRRRQAAVRDICYSVTLQKIGGYGNDFREDGIQHR